MKEFRCPPVSILAGMLTDSLRLIGLVLIMVVGSQSSGGLSTVAYWLALIGLSIQLLAHPVGWYENRFRFTGTGVEHRSGVLKRSVRFLPWDVVTAVDVSQNWAQRILGLHRVHLTQEGRSTGGVILLGVRAGKVAEIQALVRQAADRGTGQPEEPEEPLGSGPPAEAPTTVEPGLIHRATVRELLVIALVRGQVVLLGAGGLYSAWEFLDGLPFVTDQLAGFQGVPSWGKVVLILILAVTFGLLSTVVKFNDFHVRIEDGQLVTTYGLIARKDRRFDPDAVLGLVIQRNLVERFLGRARLGVLTRDQGVELEANTVLPTLPVSTVEAVAREHFPQVVPTFSFRESRSRAWVALLRFLLLLALLAGTLALVWFLRPSPWIAVSGMVIAAVVPVVLLRRTLTGFQLDQQRGIVVVRRDLVGERITTVRADCVHAVGTVSAGPWVLGAWFSTYAGSPERHWAYCVALSEVEQVRDRLLEQPVAEDPDRDCFNGARD